MGYASAGWKTIGDYNINLAPVLFSTFVILFSIVVGQGFSTSVTKCRCSAKV